MVEVLPTSTRGAEIILKPDKEPEPAKTLSVPPPEVVAAVFTPSTPRIKGDIVRYSDESDDNESDHSDERDDAGDDEEETNPKVKFFPPTPKGLRKRFSKLFCEIMRQQKQRKKFLSEYLDGEGDSEPDDKVKLKMLKNMSPKERVVERLQG